MTTGWRVALSVMIALNTVAALICLDNLFFSGAALKLFWLLLLGFNVYSVVNNLKVLKNSTNNSNGQS